MEKAVILFDGVCNLCNRTVDFVMKRDEEEKFQFGALQSDEAKELLEEHGLEGEDLDTLVLIDDGECYLKSDAYIRILNHTGGGWKLVSVIMSIVPKPIRNFFYDLVSRIRYRIFGMREKCRMPDEEVRDRFLSEKS